MRKCLAHQLHEYKVYLLVLVSKAKFHVVNNKTFQEFLLSSLALHKILEFEESIMKNKFCIG